MEKIFIKKVNELHNHKYDYSKVIYKGEIKNFLDNNKFDYVQQQTFDGCIGKKRKLPFDFYLPEQKILIEYGGQQHKKSVEFFGGEIKFKQRKRYDKIKNDFAIKNNLILIRIQHDITNINSYLTDLFFSFEKPKILIKNVIFKHKKSENYLFNSLKKIITKHITYKYPFNYNTDDDVMFIISKLFQTIDDFNSKKSKFNTWVINITQNYMIDKSRSSTFNVINNSYSYSSDDSGMITTNTCLLSTTPTSTSSDSSLENNDSLEFIENKIGIQDFHLLNMKYMEGYDYKEMAKEMRTSSSTISNRINYVKSKLKKKKK